MAVPLVGAFKIVKVGISSIRSHYRSCFAIFTGTVEKLVEKLPLIGIFATTFGPIQRFAPTWCVRPAMTTTVL
jgi:hypothetical protein